MELTERKVTIPETQYIQLKEDQLFLTALFVCCVDNWAGFEEAQKERDRLRESVKKFAERADDDV